MRPTFSLLITVSILTLISACSAKNTLSFKEKNEQYQQYIETNQLESLKKINAFRLKGWQSLTDDYLILSKSVKNKYLVKISGFCPDLNHAFGLKLNQSMDSVLSTKFDSISTLKDPDLKCYIKAIYQIDKAQSKELSAIGKVSSDEIEKKSNK